MSAIKQRGGQAFALAIPPGQTVTQPAFGTEAYFIVATGSVNMRARGRTYGTGAYSIYEQGTGLGEDSSEQFDLVDVQNPNSFPVVVYLWVGFGNFIDRRLIISNAVNAQTVNPTYAAPGTLAVVAIPDLSGTPFFDNAGKQWIATARSAIDVFNLDSSTVQFLQPLGSVSLPGAGGVANGSVQPLTPIKFAYGGNFQIGVSGGPHVNAIISEIYSAIPA